MAKQTNTSIIGDRLGDGTVSYKCLQRDFEMLPDDVATGSTCYVIDTKELYMFEATTGVWYKQ